MNSLREEKERKPKHKYAGQNTRNNYQNPREGYRQLCSKCGIKRDHKNVQQKERHVQNVKKFIHFARMCKSNVQERKMQVHGDHSSDDELYVRLCWNYTCYEQE